ncbi:MAG: OmpH family outer membrane protein [Lentisphaerota bacterium]
MKKMACMFLMASLLSWAPASAFAEGLSLAFVNLDKVFSEYDKTKVADGKLKEQADDFSLERKKLIDEYEKLQEDFASAREEAQNTALSEDARSSKRDEAENKLVEVRDYENKIRRFDESRRKQLDDQSRRIRKDLVEEIRGVINTFALKKGYTAVLDSSGQSFNGVELILYSEPKMDITEAIIEEVNKVDEKEPAK